MESRKVLGEGCGMHSCFYGKPYADFVPVLNLCHDAATLCMNMLMGGLDFSNCFAILKEYSRGNTSVGSKLNPLSELKLIY